MIGRENLLLSAQKAVGLFDYQQESAKLIGHNSTLIDKHGLLPTVLQLRDKHDNIKEFKHALSQLLERYRE